MGSRYWVLVGFLYPNDYTSLGEFLQEPWSGGGTFLCLLTGTDVAILLGYD